MGSGWLWALAWSCPAWSVPAHGMQNVAPLLDASQKVGSTWWSTPPEPASPRDPAKMEMVPPRRCHAKPMASGGPARHGEPPDCHRSKPPAPNTAHQKLNPYTIPENPPSNAIATCALPCGMPRSGWDASHQWAGRQGRGVGGEGQHMALSFTSLLSSAFGF